jgi:hypothetical protein
VAVPRISESEENLENVIKLNFSECLFLWKQLLSEKEKVGQNVPESFRKSQESST